MAAAHDPLVGRAQGLALCPSQPDDLGAGLAFLEVAVAHDLKRVVAVELGGRRTAAIRPHQLGRRF